VIESHAKGLEIVVNGRVVHTTHEHPFYVKNKGWTRATSLAVGDLLRSHNDRWIAVESMLDAHESKVYNVCVEENATYFIGDRDWNFSVWVYGACNRPETSQEQTARLISDGSQLRKVDTVFELASQRAGGGRRRAHVRPLLDEFPAVLTGTRIGDEE
jgi:hypothetical protein